MARHLLGAGVMRGAFIVALGLAVSAPSHAHPLRAHISAEGIDRIESQVPALLKDPLVVPTLFDEFLCVDIEQRNTTLALDVESADLTLLSSNAVRVELSFAAVATGELHLENSFLCLGSTTCDDTFVIDRGRAVIVLEPVQMSGAMMLDVRSLDLDIDESDVSADFSGCTLGDQATSLLNLLPGLVRQSIIEAVSSFVEQQLGAELGGMFDSMLGSFGSGQPLPGGIDLPDVDLAISDISITPDGVDISASVDISSTEPPNACVGQDPGEPSDASGPAPDPSAGSAAHVGVALNYGLIDDAVRHVWTTGLFCVDDDSLGALGLDVDYELVSRALPTFPLGTEFSLEARLLSPPSVRSGGRDSRVSVILSGVEVTLVANEPDGTVRQLRATGDVTATGDVGLDPISSALTVRVADVQLDSVVIDSGSLDLDAARIAWVLEEILVPELLSGAGEIPVSTAVVSLDDYAVIVRDLSADAAYLSVKADLFEIPDVDSGAPDTSIDSVPDRMVSPKTAVIRVSGTDALIPPELLRYQLSVDGLAAKASHFREYKIGKLGQTATYAVEVRAVDLHDNVDPTPATASVMVDGKPPRVAIAGDRTQKISAGDATVAWTASDDVTAESELTARIDVHRLTDPTDPFSTQLVESRAVPAGSTSVEVATSSGHIYRVDVRISDAVGNETLASALIDVRGDGGCSTGGGGGSAGWLALCVVVLALRRRRAI